jgi:hypothetical protein
MTDVDSAVLGLVSHKNTETGLMSTKPTGNLMVPHVLISVAVEESRENLDVESWRRWLTGIPALVKYATIQGVYKSYSTLLILSLPVMIWDMLPGYPACRFIGYVASEDLWTVKTNIPGFTVSLGRQKYRIPKKCSVRLMQGLLKLYRSQESMKCDIENLLCAKFEDVRELKASAS